MHVVRRLLVGAMLVGLIASSACTSDKSKPCPPDLDTYVRLENRARPTDPLGVTAKSALDYLAREKLPVTGYYMSKKPIASQDGKVEYDLRHESGFKKACVVSGNQSGFDGVLEIDPTSREVKRLRLR